MLTPEYLEHLPDEAVKLWQQVEDDILKDIGRRIGKADGLTDGAEWQLWRLEQTKALQKDVVKILSQYSGKSEKIIRKLLIEAGTKSLAEEDKIHAAAGNTITPINDTPALVNLLNSGYKQTMGTWKNLTATTANTVTKQFEDALDRAWLQLSSGAFDYQTAIKRTIDELADTMKTITYPSGHKDTLEVAVRRAVLTGVNQTAGKLSLERCNQMSCDLVETTAHAGARPEHAEWQGKVFSRSGKHPKYPPFSRTGYGTGAGLCGWNCRHSFYPFYEGLSKPGYTADELEKLNEKNIIYNEQQYSRYELSQMQRALERRVRKYKKRYIAENAAGIDTTVTAVKLKQSRQQLKEFAYAINSRVDTARTSTVGFGRSEASKAVWDSKRNIIFGPEGQSIIKVKKTKTKGMPKNSITQVVSAKGGITRNYYGPTGMQIKQISNNGHGYAKEEAMGIHGEHAHDYIIVNGNPVHGESRELTEQERKENSDIL